VTSFTGMSNSRTKPPATAGGHHHVAQLDEHDHPRVEDVGSSPIVVARIDFQNVRLLPTHSFASAAGFRDIWVTPSLVTERTCKACAFAHARFDSAVTHHPFG
jgi:hypothetical protein